MNKNVLAALVFTTALIAPVCATSIKAINVRGVGRIDPAVVQSYLRSKVGDTYDALQINEDLKNLFATGLFNSISFTFEADKLIISVVENPILNEIAFEGMSALPQDMVKKELHLESRQVFKKADVMKAVDILLQIYRAKGYFNARVTPQIITRPENRVDLIFKVEEGAPTNISKINMIGNSQFETIELKSVIDSEETGALSFFQTSNVYDPNRVRVDEEKLRRHYLKNGFYDFKLERSNVELLPGYEGFHITYQLSEGAQYSIGAITIQNPFTDIDTQEALAELPIVQGDIYNQENIEKSIDALNDYYASKGLPFVQITPDLHKNEEAKTIQITYRVVPSEKVFIERIVIEGNHLTRESVIRSQLMLSEGDPLNPILIRRSLKNIRNLGLFEPFIATDKRKGSAPDKVVLVLRVSERAFFSIMGGASYGSKGLAGNASVSHRNIQGTGIGAQAQTSFGANTQSLSALINKPSVFRDIDLSFSGSFKHDEDKDYSIFTEFSYLMSPTVTFNWTENFRTSIDYTFKHFDTDFHPEKQSERTKHNLQFGDRKEKGYKSSSALDLIYDTRDDRLNPTEGFKAGTSLEYAGIGGDVNYVKWDIAADYYVPFGRTGVVLAFKGNYGTMWEVGDKYINFFERYRLGYLSFRGFEVAGLGPREAREDSKKAGPSTKGEGKNQLASNGLGGLNMYKVTTEFSFPLVPDTGIRILAFVDVGSVWGLGTPKTLKPEETNTVDIVTDSHKLHTRASAGFGLQADLPLFGRIVAGFAKPLIKEKYDQEEVFFFSLGGGM